MARSAQTIEAQSGKKINLDQLIAAALDHHRRDELDRAETLYREILTHDGEHPDALHLLGVLAQQVGNSEASAELISRAIALRPDAGQYYSDLGNARISTGDAAGARRAYEQGLALDPDNAVAWSNLGSLHKSQRRLDEAEDALRRAVMLQPDLGDAVSNLGGVLLDQGKTEDAVIQCERAALLVPESASAHANLAAALKEQGDLDRAAAAARQATALDPRFAQAHAIRAAILLDQGDASGAKQACQSALTIDPGHVEALYNLGNAEYDLGDEDAAAEFFQRVLTLRPDFADAHLALGRIRLQQRDLSGFWSVYARRWDSRAYTGGRRDHPQRHWQGESLAGKSILVWGEQGIGDELFFAGLIPEITASASRCLIETEPRLVPLLGRSFPDAKVFARTDLQPKYPHDMNIDYQVPMGDIGRWQRSSYQGFKPLGRYLNADPYEIDACRARYAELGEGPLVGISWASRASKHIDLDQWSPILNCRRARFVSLQYGDRAEEIATVAASTGVEIYDDLKVDPLTDMDGFAAQVAAMDFVVTIDNSTLAVAAGLDIQTIAMLPRSTDWRYLGEENACPWHECLTLFQQTPEGGWSPVIEQAAERLRQYLSSDGEA